MAEPRLEFAIFMFAFGCAAMQPRIEYRLENSLDACVKIDQEASSWNGQLAVLELRYHMAKSTAECGCKSALSAYSSFAELSTGEQYMIGGTITLAGSDEVTLPLSIDRDLLGQSSLRVSLACERPE
jgi:hypothetical protein